MDRKLAKKLDSESDRVLHSISQLVGWIASDPRAPTIPLANRAASSSNSSSHSTNSRNPSVDVNLHLADVTTNQSFASNLGELVDHLLESADTCLDEYTGKLAPRKLGSAAEENAASGNAAGEIGTSSRLQAMTAVQNGKALPKTGNLPSWVLNAPISPPQRHFTRKPDNSADSIWLPHLKYGKPNAKVALGHVHPPRFNTDGTPIPRGPRRGMYCAEGDPLDNPYHHEIMHADPPSHALSKPDPVAKDNPPPALNEKDPWLSTDACPFQWVSTKQQIEQLRDHLDEPRVNEIAIDLEHHSYRTYQGIVCLMQLSTRWGDWIIDTLSDDVRQHAELLNSSFTNPDKVKVLHGANHDVLWLQRDLGLYLVNLFDTYHATNVLMFPSHGLNYLMARYCNFDADKRYQLADWRIRPLPKEMLYYARSDTHTLLFIYDNLRHELMEAGGIDAIRQVFIRSKQVATATYAKEQWDTDGETREGWRTVWRKWGGEAALGTEHRKEVSQMKKEERLVRALHRWRDTVAREEDESPRYILGANNLMMLAARAPTTKQGVLACIPPNATGLKKRIDELASLIMAEVADWQKDQQARRDESKQRLSAALLNSDNKHGELDQEMDAGEAIRRDAVVKSVTNQQDTTKTSNVGTLPSISAWSRVTGADEQVDVSVWSDATTTGGSASDRRAIASRFGGAVRSLASNLFGRSNASATRAAAAVSHSNLSSSSSKLFGTSAPLIRDRDTCSTAQVDSVKAGFIGQVEVFLGNPVSSVPERGDIMMQPDSVAFVPSGDRATCSARVNAFCSTEASQRAPTPAEAADDDDDDGSSEKDDYIIVSTTANSKKSKNKPNSSACKPESTAPSKKELKKKRKAEEAAGALATDSTTSAHTKKRKGKFQGEFDFSSTRDALQAAASETKQHGASPSNKQSGSSSKRDGSKPRTKDHDAAVFRQPRDRARRKTGMGSTM